MGLSKEPSQDTDTPEGWNTLSSHMPLHSPPVASATTHSNPSVPKLPSAVALNQSPVPSSNVASDDMPNTWVQELAYRPATRKMSPSSRVGESDFLLPSEGHGRSENETQIRNSPHGQYEGVRGGASAIASRSETSVGSSFDDGLPSSSTGRFQSNNPLMRARQTNNGALKYPIPVLDPFDFSQTNNLDHNQCAGNSVAQSPSPHGLDMEFSQLSPPRLRDSSCGLEDKTVSLEAETSCSSEEKRNNAVTSDTRSVVNQPLVSYPQSDKIDVLAQSLKPADLNIQETPKSTELIQTVTKDDPEKPIKSLLDDEPESLPGIYLSRPDNLGSPVPSTVPNSTIPASPTLSGTTGSGQFPSVPQDKLAETYDIRLVNWTDGRTALRKSPMLVQNENGPCPLLALVNGFVMRSKADSPSPITKALQSREKISLGLLVQALFDELTSYTDGADQLPDTEALSSFLIMLHTGMNVNPQLVLTEYPCDTPGTFLETNDIRLYSSFKVPLVHGWLARPSSAAAAALKRVAQNYEDIQLLHFRKEELEDRVFRGGSLDPDEEKLIEDIDTIQHFVNVENATQLSVFGLEHLKKCLEPGSISILFRNDHFSTLFKHPLSYQLFTLVTDAGYASHAEIVWESLVDVNGCNTGFFSGDFRPVGNLSPPVSLQNTKQGGPVTSGGSTLGDNVNGSVEEPTENTEQTDADYAFALALQFQDEEEQRRTNPSRRSRNPTPLLLSNIGSTSLQSEGITDARSNSGSNFCHQQSTPSTGRRVRRGTQEVRSLIPPRAPAVDPGIDAPPPTYEQAANSPRYNPPPGHLQRGDSQGSNPSIVGPRSSSYGFNQNLGRNFSPFRNNRHAPASSTSLPPRPRDKDRSKDCTVM
ncbi:hypothetical protein GX48_01235 [Paracoccidioides brasiliensis]|nr:hypothetical protein GX48_01235 [Paracoccidioides brasiliensis]